MRVVDDFGGSAPARPVHGRGPVRAYQLPQISRPDPDDEDYPAWKQRRQQERERDANPPPPPPPTIKKLCRFCDENWTLWGLKPRDGSGLIPCCVKCAPEAVKRKRTTVKRLAEGQEGPLEETAREGLAQRLEEEGSGDDEGDDGRAFWDKVAGPHPAKAPGDDDPTVSEQTPVSTTKVRADSAAMGTRERASSSEDERMMTNRSTPAPSPPPSPPPSLPEVPAYKWHEGDPPPVRPGPKRDRVKIDWSMLLGIATTRPGRWLKRPGTSHNAKTLAARDGFEVVYREGMVYLRAVDPEDWDGDGEDQGENDQGEDG